MCTARSYGAALQELQSLSKDTASDSSLCKDTDTQPLAHTDTHKQAVQLLTRALLSNRSAAFVGAGRWREALADAEALACTWPHWAKAWFRAGRALEEGRQYTAAVWRYARAHQLSQGNPPHAAMWDV